MSNMVVRTNVFALNAHRNMRNVGLEQGRAAARLSSGYRINSAADDAAGLGISESMRAQIRGLDQASRNAQDGQALIQTAEGGMQEMQNMLQRARELTVQAANDTNTTVNRESIRAEVQQLSQEFTSMANRVQFNGMDLLTASGPDEFFFQVGANANQGVTLDAAAIHTAIAGVAGIFSGIGASLGADAGAISGNIAVFQTQIDAISTQRGLLGAAQNRMDFTIRSLEISSENLSDAESRIRNTDMAREMMRFTMSNVLQQASVSMLAQANQLPNNLLSLLR